MDESVSISQNDLRQICVMATIGKIALGRDLTLLLDVSPAIIQHKLAPDEVNEALHRAMDLCGDAFNSREYAEQKTAELRASQQAAEIA